MKFALLLLLSLFVSFPIYAEAAVYREIKTLPLEQSFGTIGDWHATASQP